MAKQESTAITRLIELAQQRPVDADIDWFGAPPPPRVDVTEVVRRPRRRLASAWLVAGAFVAGMVTVAVVLAATSDPAPSTPTPGPAAPAAGPGAPGQDPAAPAPIATRALPGPAAPLAVAPLAVGDEPPAAEPPAPAAEPPASAAEPPAPAAEPPAPAAEPPAPAAAPPRTERSRPARPARPARGSRATTSHPARPRPPTRAAERALLLVGSKPPCQLYVDGKLIGWTPQRGIPLSPGRHRLLLRNRDQGIARKMIVEARAGQTVKVIRDFTDPTQ